MLRLGKGLVPSVVLLLVLAGSASARSLPQRSGDAAAAQPAMSSTPVLTPAQVQAAPGVADAPMTSSLLGSSLSLLSAAPPALPSTGCGASGTIADQSGFEDADGNLSVDKAGCMDWNGFAPVAWTGSVPYQTAATVNGNFFFTGVSDAFNSNTDTSYAGGVKQADECPATGTGSVNNKSDVARIYVAASTDPVTKHVYLNLAWLRAPLNTTSSDVHIGFEFNQSKTPCGAGSGLVRRTPGDILLIYNFQSGTASIAYSQWTGSAWTAEATLPPNVAEAQVFGGRSTPDALKPSNGFDPATNEFGEAGLDLTAATVGLGNDGRPCENFATIFGESRTSGSSTSAQMKDLVGPGNLDLSNCATPSLTTTQQPASGAMGETFRDQATIAGLRTPDGTGSIMFQLYSAADCGGSVLDTETVTGINADSDYTTPNGYTIHNAGTYYWVATFSGDGYNNAAMTGCNDEPVTVATATPSIVTTQQPASGSVGDTYKDTATLSDGVNYTGTGSITFKLYSTSDCSGPVLHSETVPAITANGDYTTPNGFVIQNAGTYYWVVSFTGDANNKLFNSGCDNEPVEVKPAAIQIVKTADEARVNAGDPIGFTLTVYNTGAGNAYGVRLSDLLPTNAGLSWQIADQGAGWGNSCAITAGTLSCGPVTVPAGTTEAESSFTVHITSTTTAATGGVCPGNGVVNNTGSVSTTNDGSEQSSASTCVAAPWIKIVKTADAPLVSAGDPIGFTLTVFNTGPGDAYGVTLSDVLPTKAGLSWQIASQGAGWGGTCAITAGTLKCGPVTVPGGTTQAASTFTVHITSPTTAATGGICPGGSGVVDNTGVVSTTNNGSRHSTASTCVASSSIQIVKTADAAQVNAGDPIGFTLTVSNSGTGAAKGVSLSDPLPTNAGLSWQIQSQGAGWGNSCAITAGTLSCGPVTVPGGTTQGGSTFTVHVTSSTTAATGGVCPGGSGVVDNTASVTTTNDGSEQSSASTCVAGPSIKIVKTADAAQVNVGDPIGFTLTVYNAGSGAAYGVRLSDPLPTNSGLSWQIQSQGAGWANSCAITAGTLSCGPVTVPGGTTQAGSTFTVHITSATTGATGGICPIGSGVVDNTGSVTTSNDGSDQASASTCVAGAADLQITKTGSPKTQDVPPPFKNITWTMVVTNNGPSVDTNVMVGDPVPVDNTFVSSHTTKGTCTGGVILSCSLGTLQVGESVTITLVTHPTKTGLKTNTATVIGDLPETNTDNNVASASVLVNGPGVPPVCTAVHVLAPKQLNVGQPATIRLKVTQGTKAVKGVRVRIWGHGTGISVITSKSNSMGKISLKLHPQKAGILNFKPIVYSPDSACQVVQRGIAKPPNPTG
jgi:uncharacterized repeat protein (TIGR01451 family)